MTSSAQAIARTLDKPGRTCYTANTQGYNDRTSSSAMPTLAGVSRSGGGESMDEYDIASADGEGHRLAASLCVCEYQGVQELHAMARDAVGELDACEECGEEIDALRRRSYPAATTCRQCAQEAMVL